MGALNFTSFGSQLYGTWKRGEPSEEGAQRPQGESMLEEREEKRENTLKD